MTARRWAIGQATVTAIIDEPCFEIELSRIFPGADPARFADEHWLDPDHLDRARAMVRMGMQSWLIRTGRLNILIDSCIGAHKDRAAHPAWHMRDTNSLMDGLRAEGLGPADIDLVFCTHLHADHVGWNTELRDGHWVPTFPNARYAMSAIDYDDMAQRDAASATPVNFGAFRDSILPVVATNQAMFVSGGDELAQGISILSLAGHSIDHLGVEVRGGGKAGLFCGDAIHSPIQLIEPALQSAFCTLPEAAAVTRLAMLERVAEHGHMLFPAHFRGAGMARLARKGASFRPIED
ncbi:MBL fold metallo-hydrolase [Sphingomonas crocodyli]|uniref:MBL fold metallo-hydrolase n=1 Tax=Sphingomonas crocodyli TaxID=1979270 RepID=A0A437LZU1_9SPHN|nr:MBL fold metallo-hydrolase [Sphingomonas crocodyli]RVT90951.1 MBL fold metallo-hydrolase [Sphingomonas crocodyli]